MRKIWIAFAVCAGVVLGFGLENGTTVEAAMLMKAPQQNMSLISPVVKKSELKKRMKKGQRYTCTDWGFMHCCTSAEHSFCVDEVM